MTYDVAGDVSKLATGFFSQVEGQSCYTDGIFTYIKDGERFVRRAQVKFEANRTDVGSNLIFKDSRLDSKMGLCLYYCNNSENYQLYDKMLMDFDAHIYDEY